MADQATVRVAAYARISVADRDATQFSSIEAQMDAITAYAKSQESTGWTLVAEPYIDDGYSGATTDRPALDRLLEDVAAGRIDVVVVHRFDRFSRSQRDFLNMLHALEKHGTDFVSVTQSLDTGTPMGRCMMSVITAFAQMEREVIAERTRDKMLATRRKGMWTGGRPVLGYDVVEKRLVVNEPEAEQVRAVFALYLELGSLLAVVDELKTRGWTNKRWCNKAGAEVGGTRFNKVTLSHLLKNPLYVGKVSADGELHEGAHEAIVTEEAQKAVSQMLKAKANTRRSRRRANSTALLAGIVRCAACGSGMTSHHTKRGDRRYAYYVCNTVQKEGAAACPGSRVAAGELERFVVDQIREIGRDPELIEAIVAADQADRETLRPELTAEVRKHEATVRRLNTERENIVTAIAEGVPTLASRVAELDAETAAAEPAATAARNDLQALGSGAVNADELRRLDPVWDALFPAERARLLDLLLERIEFDGGAGDVSITFRPGGPHVEAAQ